MSGYKMFADRLDYAFKEARTKYTEAYNLMLAKRKDMEDIKRNPSLADTFGMKAEYDYNQAKADFEKAETVVWEDFERQMAEIGKALKSAFTKVNQARPEDIDRDGLELLNSGILTVDELGPFLDRYEGNPTMERFVARHIEKLLKDTKEQQTRRKLIILHQKAMASNIMEAWKNLENSARTCTGQTHGKGEPRYVLSISSQWERLTEEAIKNF